MNNTENKKKSIELKSYAKINLTLDVKGVLPNGMHEVEMIMQQILLCDDVLVSWEEAEVPKTSYGGAPDMSDSGGFEINLKTNRVYLPTDERNLAYKAAKVMYELYGDNQKETGKPGPKGSKKNGKLKIDIKKRIPVAAGLAGGSGNGAAVLHAINVLWNLGLDVKTLCRISTRLGSDVAFCVMGQAAANSVLKSRFAGDPLTCHCALATGVGTDLKPLDGLKSHLVLSKPSISVSTASVYKGIDSVEIPERPNTEEMIKGLSTKNSKLVKKNMVNILENYTLKEYPTVVYTKNKMQNLCNSGAVLMSGSGPTVFGLCNSMAESKRICEEMKKDNRESFWTRTTY